MSAGLRSLAVGLLLAAAPCPAAEVVVVLSADSGPYREAYEAFSEAFGSGVPVLSAAAGLPRLPEEARVVVAFGGSAARLRYPSRVALVYGAAPGTLLGADPHGGARVGIQMVPRPEVLLQRLRRLQPSLKRLAVLWSGAAFADTVEKLRAAAEGAGVALLSERVRAPAELPDHLRALQGRVDAIWLAPDPLLITQERYELLLNFVRPNRIPLYVPTEGLLEKGASASVAVSFGDVGREAAAAARTLLSGGSPPSQIYSERVRVGLNLPGAAASGLRPPPAAEADRVLR